mmetsp:Transcript_95654/g.274647  ORF Transcript_95654/g.274647 Transcript_95654/m.274647 type:complete len:368 (+) Transcript_95654:66-1169(+)|eukprot:CAMPEP_0177193170 /NCGR_PEP_ID=MMETSP0367-20130122/22295_1 /TAXON_ID=447022 ORGANISM="Scrippsiella hangoei-like, Strain SHHI-4" /NCGR_SAMPLE_ID=MMETSP0367 /ASSEMBLY_ACC=CAM_ASM_000362 /LENGTH=367 /DNA_ID=CAMNT_0018641029 /DNA_START=61 /DNA_END=1164 /DNA_ORIENTATION=-
MQAMLPATVEIGACPMSSPTHAKSGRGSRGSSPASTCADSSALSPAMQERGLACTPGGAPSRPDFGAGSPAADHLSPVYIKSTILQTPSRTVSLDDHVDVTTTPSKAFRPPPGLKGNGMSAMQDQKPPGLEEKTRLSLPSPPGLDKGSNGKTAMPLASSPTGRSPIRLEDFVGQSFTVAAGERGAGKEGAEMALLYTGTYPGVLPNSGLSPARMSAQAFSPGAMGSPVFWPTFEAGSRISPHPGPWPQVPEVPLSPMSAALSPMSPNFGAPVLKLDLADALPEPELGSDERPTMGSTTHRGGNCKPCAFLYTKGCMNGTECPFCHLCDAGEKKRRQKEKKEQKRDMHKWQDQAAASMGMYMAAMGPR